MAKLKPITTEELIAAVNAEGLGFEHPYESELDMGTATKQEKRAQIPGTVGTTKTGDDAHYMSYVVDKNGIMTKTVTHNSFEEAYAMALERFREFAHEEFKDRTYLELMNEYDHLEEKEVCRKEIIRRLGDTGADIMNQYDEAKANDSENVQSLRESLEENLKAADEKPKEPSFVYGPCSDHNSPYMDEYNKRLMAISGRKRIKKEYEVSDERLPIMSFGVGSAFVGKSFSDTIVMVAPEERPCPLTAEEMKTCVEEAFSSCRTDYADIKDLNVKYDKRAIDAVGVRGIRYELAFCASNAYTITYTSPVRPEGLKYDTAIEQVNKLAFELIEAKEVGEDLDSALSNLEDSRMEL